MAEGHRNRLADENSPYLLSHADNPVDWYPWGEQALEKAKVEDKPIFLSIGYAACHWCHVMGRESFENEEIARFLNDHFVSIKVDREQRPDLDQIYMNFTTAMTGQGGWPMSVFLTGDLKPFFAGTYFPPDDRYGRPGFKKVITEIAKAYSEEKEMVVSSAQDIFEQVASQLEAAAAPGIFSRDMLKRSAEALMRGFDETHGGFGQAPKFPHGLELSFFLRYYKISGDLSYLKAAEKSLRAMARGGIYDQLGGGFARYSTDREWLVPHFEKMLYDNALLVPVYAQAFQITKDDFYRQMVRGTLDFILREMTDQSGGFYSALDADSDGEEGKFYVWTSAEIREVLADDADVFERYYNVSAKGNFEGKNILHVTQQAERVRDAYGAGDFDDFLKTGRAKLLEARNRRVRPFTDDKILTSWNGLALSALCRGYQVTADRKYLEAAIKNADCVRGKLHVDGRLAHSYREGKLSVGEFLEDYAFYVAGLLDLFESDGGTGNHKWLEFAVELTERGLELFLDEEGRFYLRPDNESDLIIRPKDETDGAIPSPGSIMISNLLRLNRLTAESTYLENAEKALRAISGLVERYPGGMTSALLAIDYYFSDKVEIVIVGSGEGREEMLREVYQRYFPNRIIALGDGSGNGGVLFEGRSVGDGEVAAYVCVNSVCQLPVLTIVELRERLDRI